MSENTPNIPRGEIKSESPTEQQTTKEPQTQQHKFPTEIIDLPSKGHYYPIDSPLSSGEVELKYMTAREEDILTSQTLIRKGVVLDKLLESVIVNPDIDINDLLLGDKNAIYITTRILGYGPQYNVEITCPSCGKKQKEAINLGQLSTREIDFSAVEKGTNRFKFELPVSKKIIEWKLLTHGENEMIEQELIALKKYVKDDISYSVTTRLKYVIVSLDGNTDKSKIKAFVDNELLARDIKALRSEMETKSPDVDMSYTFSCASCNAEEEMDVPMGIEFFWPTS